MLREGHCSRQSSVRLKPMCHVRGTGQSRSSGGMDSSRPTGYHRINHGQLSDVKENATMRLSMHAVWALAVLLVPSVSEGGVSIGLVAIDNLQYVEHGHQLPGGVTEDYGWQGHSLS